MHVCNCGYYGSNIKKCTCSDYEVERYLSRFNGPLLDRIDIFTSVNPVSFDEINNERKSESSAIIRKRIERAREIQRDRFKSEKVYCNSEMNGELIKKFCRTKESSKELLKMIYNNYGLSTRVYNKILKVARTIADLEGLESIEENHIIEAIQYRKYVRQDII